MHITNGIDIVSRVKNMKYLASCTQQLPGEDKMAEEFPSSSVKRLMALQEEKLDRSFIIDWVTSRCYGYSVSHTATLVITHV
jgi:hypothetical protein